MKIDINIRANNSKLSDKNKLEHQLELFLSRLIMKYDILSDSIKLSFETIGDDFICNQFHLKLSFEGKLKCDQ